MSNFIFKLPDIGEGTAEAELVAWHVNVGDTVQEDQPLADVMTDKATVEITSPVDGVVTALHGEVGVLSAVGSPFIEFRTSGDAPAEEVAPTPALEAASAPVEAPKPAAAPAAAHRHRPRTSPAVRSRAQEAGIDLHDVQGTGPNGRIRRPDLDAYLAGGRSAKPAVGASSITSVSPSFTAGSGESPDYVDIKLMGLRRKIAEKMEVSTRRIPHFTYTEEVDATELERARAQLNARYEGKRPKLTFLPFFIKALTRLLPDFPQINATFDEDAGIIRQHRVVHAGIATQTDNGLIVSVVRNAERRGLWNLADELRRVSTAARDGSAKREELSGSTITITSLGPLAGISFTPVINHPKVAIIGPNKIVERPVVRNGIVEVRKMMNISSSFDHRIVDGYDAALFIQQLKQLIEDPLALLAE